MADTSHLFARGHGLVARAGGLHPPADVLLSWPAANYENPETRGWEAPIILIIMLVATTIIYVARMWARLVVAKNHGWDDVMMTLSMLPVIGLTVSAILGMLSLKLHLTLSLTPESNQGLWVPVARVGSNTRNPCDVPRGKVFLNSMLYLELTVQITMSIELNYIFSTTLIKVSILLFYRRLTGSLNSAFVYSIWGMIFFCVVPSIIFTFLIIFTCTPVIGNFRIFDISWMIKHGSELECRDEGAIIVACAILGSVQDLLICILPAMLVWDLKMSARQKAAVCAIFGVGLISCICGILRSYYATYVYYRKRRCIFVISCRANSPKVHTTSPGTRTMVGSGQLSKQISA